MMHRRAPSPPHSPSAPSHRALGMTGESHHEHRLGPRSRPTSPSTASQRQLLQLLIKCPSLGSLDCDTRLMTVSADATIKQVKANIETTWPGRPKAEGMRCIRAGRLLSDEDVVGNVVVESERHEPASLHLVIRPDAWSEPRLRRAESSTSRPVLAPLVRTASTGSIASIRTASCRSTPRPLASSHHDLTRAALPSMAVAGSGEQPGSRTTDAGRQFHHLLADLDPSQYSAVQSLVTLAFHKYADLYESHWFLVYGDDCARLLGSHAAQKQAGPAQLESVAQSMGFSLDEAVQSLQIFEEASLQWLPLDGEGAKEATLGGNQASHTHRQVTIEGLPFLLQLTTDAPTVEANRRLGDVVERLEVLRDLSNRLDRLMSFQHLLRLPSSPSTDDAARAGIGLHLARQHQQATTAAAAEQQGRRRVQMRTALVLNLDEVFHVTLPMLFLSFKVAILIYIFTRGASDFKKNVMIATAVAYVAWEAWKLARMRQVRRQLRQARQHARNQQQQQQQQQQQPQEAGGQQTAARQNERLGQGDDLIPQAPARSVVTSPLQVEFWIERLAYLHLEVEDRQLGFRHLDGSPASDLPVEDFNRSPLRLAYEVVVLPLVLSVATLVPEIEERRRRAIETRDALIRSTARKFEERRTRAREQGGQAIDDSPHAAAHLEASASKRSSNQAGEEGGEEGGDQPATDQVPTLLKTAYAQRLLRKYRGDGTGRQLDIQEELDAAAAAAAAAAAQNADEGAEQADMGFF